MNEVEILKITLTCNSPMETLNDWIGEINGYAPEGSSLSIQWFMKASGFDYQDLSNIMNLLELNPKDNTWDRLIRHWERGGREEVKNYFKEVRNGS